MNGKSKAWAFGLLLGAFLIGGVVGAVVDRSIAPNASGETGDSRRSGDRDRRERYLDWLAAELSLSEQQRDEVAVIIERNREEVAALWKQTRPAFEELKQRLRSEVREVLTDEQRTAYEGLIAAERDRHRRRR
ncbi:MAG: hypothetical protein PVJ43_06995 [Gemmatimonadales bacterium]|jgi:gas vesicle protein